MKVGVTGGIGSGKSVVCDIFRVLGVPVYHADERAKEMYGKEDVRKAVAERFGDQLFAENGELDRSSLADLVFNDPDALKDLNAIIHPELEKDYDNWLKANESEAYTLKEAAILVETGAYRKMDALICVEAPEELRIQRVMDRDCSTLEQVKERMARQISDAERRKFANFTIRNDGQHPLLPQVLTIHSALIQDRTN